jgi:hypothetical protein
MNWTSEPWAGTWREVSGDYWIYEDGYSSDLSDDWPYACAYFKDENIGGGNIYWDDKRCIGGKDMTDIAKEICEAHQAKRNGQVNE